MHGLTTCSSFPVGSGAGGGGGWDRAFKPSQPSPCAHPCAKKKKKGM